MKPISIYPEPVFWFTVPLKVSSPPFLPPFQRFFLDWGTNSSDFLQLRDNYVYASRLMAIVNVRKDVALMKSIIVDVTMSVKKHIERSDDQIGRITQFAMRELDI